MRLLLASVTGVACIIAGATAGLLAFASEFHWPLSPANFAYSFQIGIYWGIAGALITIVFLSLADRNYLWVASAISVLITWLVAFIGVWLCMVLGLG